MMMMMMVMTTTAKTTETTLLLVVFAAVAAAVVAMRLSPREAHAAGSTALVRGLERSGHGIARLAARGPVEGRRV